MSATRYPVFTVGHSNHSMTAFVALLQKHGINEVLDVRSSPYSRYAPHFNRNALDNILGRVGKDGIKYIFMGDELGGRPADRSCYDPQGRVCYEQLSDTALFRLGIVRTIRIANEHRAVLMCSESEPLNCHRTLLVARVLVSKGIDVRHILADGGLEYHTDLLYRLLAKFNLPRDGDLFRSPEEVIDVALKRQATIVGHLGESADSV